MALEPIVTKVDENHIKVEKPQPATINNYEYEFLVAQRSRIIGDAIAYQAARQKELDEVDVLIAQAKALGVKEKEMPVAAGEVIVP